MLMRLHGMHQLDVVIGGSGRVLFLLHWNARHSCASQSMMTLKMEQKTNDSFTTETFKTLKANLGPVHATVYYSV